MHVYLDESGDLGFGRRSTKNFVVSMVATPNPNEVRNCVKYTKRRKYGRKAKNIPELKFCYSPEKVRLYMLNMIASRKNIDLFFLNVPKRRVKSELRDNPEIIYNYVSGTLMDWLVIL